MPKCQVIFARALKITGVSSSGKTRAFGARIRGFESSHPSHFLKGVRFKVHVSEEQKIKQTEPSDPLT